jgi:hypothetical protein
MSRKHGEGDGALGRGQKGVERWDNTRGSRRLFPVEAVPREKRGWGSGRAVEEADQGGPGSRRRHGPSRADGSQANRGGTAWADCSGQPVMNSDICLLFKNIQTSLN